MNPTLRFRNVQWNRKATFFHNTDDRKAHICLFRLSTNSNLQKKEDSGYQPKSSVYFLRSVAHTLLRWFQSYLWFFNSLKNVSLTVLCLGKEIFVSVFDYPKFIRTLWNQKIVFSNFIRIKWIKSLIKVGDFTRTLGEFKVMNRLKERIACQLIHFHANESSTR